MRIYRYKFLNKDFIIQIEANNKIEARSELFKLSKNDKDLQGGILISETIVKPVFGVTQKKVNDITFFWVGFEYSENGWMDANNFKLKFKDYEQKGS